MSWELICWHISACSGCETGAETAVTAAPTAQARAGRRWRRRPAALVHHRRGREHGHGALDDLLECGLRLPGHCRRALRTSVGLSETGYGTTLKPHDAHCPKTPPGAHSPKAPRAPETIQDAHGPKTSRPPETPTAPMNPRRLRPQYTRNIHHV